MNGLEQRKYWLDLMIQIGDPVLSSLAQRKLKDSLPVDPNNERSRFAPLEAFGRLACGIAPWLELQDLEGEEEELRMHYNNLMLVALDAATDFESSDLMDFETPSQPLVDAAFLAHALVRAPLHITDKLDDRVRTNVISALKKTRKILPGANNWLLFSAMVEAGIYVLGDENYDRMRVNYAIRMFMEWYCGDGIYGDGVHYRADYYNSYVIQPMLVDLIKLFEHDSSSYSRWKPIIMDRASRYASVLERVISPDGTYPLIGRSITYRFGAFHHLSQVALQHGLEDQIKPAQVRCALTSVMKRTIEVPGNFDDHGWLRPGVYGYQPSLAEDYINTGSLYLCATVFLPLGLSPTDEFWSAPNEQWTSQIILSGRDFPADYAMDH